MYFYNKSKKRQISNRQKQRQNITDKKMVSNNFWRNFDKDHLIKTFWDTIMKKSHFFTHLKSAHVCLKKKTLFEIIGKIPYILLLGACNNNGPVINLKRLIIRKTLWLKKHFKISPNISKEIKSFIQTYRAISPFQV